jgi:hypothetical protein
MPAVIEGARMCWAEYAEMHVDVMPRPAYEDRGDYVRLTFDGGPSKSIVWLDRDGVLALKAALEAAAEFRLSPEKRSKWTAEDIASADASGAARAASLKWK